MNKDIEIERLKEGYAVEGAGAKKEFVFIQDVNMKWFMHYLAGGLFVDYAHQWEYLKVVFSLWKLELKIRRLRNYRD